MRTIRTMCAIVLAAILSAAGLASAGAAAADPYPPIMCAHLGVSTTTPHPGQHITVTGSGYQPGDAITLELDSSATVLAHVTADANGAFSTTVTIPANLTRDHLLIAVGGQSSCPVDPITLRIQSGSGVGGVSTGGQTPAFTGVAIASALLIAAGLLAAGVAVTRAGRRRRSASGRHAASA